MKLSYLVRPDFNAAMKVIFDAHLRARTMFTVSQVKPKIETALKDFDAARKTVLERHADKDDEGKPISKVDDEGREFFSFPDIRAVESEMSELMEQDVEIASITLTEKEIDDSSLTTKDLGVLIESGMFVLAE